MQNYRYCGHISIVRNGENKIFLKTYYTLKFLSLINHQNFEISSQPSAIMNILCATDIHKSDEKVHQVTLAVAYLYTAICPFLYAFNLKDFRAASKKLFSKKETPDLSLSSKRKVTSRFAIYISFESSDESENEEFEEENNEDDFRGALENIERL